MEQLRAEHLLEKEVALEEEAIRLLGDRAVVAKARYTKEGDPQKAPDVDAYLKGNEKGTVKRLERLAAQRESLRKMKSARTKASRELDRRIRGALRQKDDKAYAGLLRWLLAAPAPVPKPPPQLPRCVLAVDHALAVAMKLKSLDHEERLAAWVPAALGPLTGKASDPSGECGEPGEPGAAGGAPTLSPEEQRAKDLLWQLLPLRAPEGSPAEGDES